MNTIQMIPLDRIDPHPKNPRRDLGDLRDLAKSIKAQGIQQNLLLIPHEVINGALREDRYMLVIGHRRKAAAELAGLIEIPAVVDPSLTEAQQLELMLLENLQRKEITAIEEAEGYQELLDLDVPVAEIAKKTGRPAKLIRDRVKLLDLPEVAQERIHSGQGSLLDASKLDEFEDDPATLDELAALIGTNNFAQKLQAARDTRKRHAEQQPIVVALLAKGLTELTERAQVCGRSWITDIREAVKVEGLMLPAGSVFMRGTYYADVEVWGPESAPLSEEQEEAEKAAAAERDAQWRADRARREADAAEAEECWKVRDAWIRERITGRFTHQQRAMIAQHAAIFTLLGGVGSYTLGTWLGIDGYPSDSRVAKAAAKWGKGLDWAALQLVFLHLAAGHSWERAALPPLYEVLEDLGYPVSDVERAHLAPAADEDGE